MAGSDDSASPEPLETTEALATAEDSTVTPEQWRAMREITDKVYRHREKNGHDPSKLFQRKVNKRIMPDYYDVIKEPVALSTLRAKLLHKSYTNIAEYVRDAALIVHNAQTYNRPESGAFQDSMILKDLFEKEFETQAEQGTMTADEAKFPDLGELPPVEDLAPLPDEEDDEEDEDDEDEEEEEDVDESDEEGGRRRKRRGPRSTAAIAKREGGSKGESAPTDSRKRRGRPPKVDTPMEARIKNILKVIRRTKSDDGRFMYYNFEKLPDKSEHPHYYMEIKEPLAIEQIKVGHPIKTRRLLECSLKAYAMQRKQKRKKYNSVDHFMRDMDIMFNNCKSYNEPDSSLYKDAVALQAESHRLAEEEKAKPDADLAMEEGRLPLPNGIQHNGEVWKVGDWIRLQNPNDVTKPIIAQIYRTWQDGDGEKWMNACWYYRPEQTVHHYEKHFFPSEVVKTGQYRDHRVEEIVDRCFVMFITRYSRGRPRGFPPNKEVYVCESRYNEEKHRMNKIKTWASCLPDEVRDKDYEMDLFDRVKRVKKVPSPILYLLKEDDKDSNQHPKPRWGADNAPPVVGAVYKGPRHENQTPPPEPTPSPPPQPPAAAAKPPKMQAYETSNYRSDANNIESIDRATAAAGSHPNQSFAPAQHNQYHQNHPASPAPIHHPHSYTQQASGTYTQPLEDYSTPPAKYGPTNPGTYSRPSEVYRLPDNANQLIPEDIRDQFHQDDHGRVLFFAAPPIDTLPPIKAGSAIAHSAKYLAAKLRDKIAAKEKRKANGEMEIENGTTAEEEDLSKTSQHPPKRVKTHHTDADADEDDMAAAAALEKKINKTRLEAMQLWVQQMQNSTDRLYMDIYGEHWQEGKKYQEEKLAANQSKERARLKELEQSMEARQKRNTVDLVGSQVFKDDYDPRY